MANIAEIDRPSLFPILRGPVALARMAAEAEPAGVGYEVEFKTLEARSILNRSISRRQLSLTWSINPYRGCEFACRYCYARYTHEFLEPAGATAPLVSDAVDSADPQEPQVWATAFERRIYIKQHAAWLLEQDLRKVGPGEEIALGTATDPYQPIERKAGVTRSLLEVFARKSRHRIGIVTKSNLILRDIDLLQQIAERNTLVVHVTITTADTELARKLEPRAPRPDLRFQAVAKLREAGLTAGIFASPLLLGITDTPESLDRVAARAAYARASFLAAHPLFLKQCSRPTYLSFVREYFPTLLPMYEEHFRTADFAGAAYKEKMAAMVREVCRRHHLPQRSTDALLTRDAGSMKKGPVTCGATEQQRLFA
jgi:DNA repair photolyase